MDKYIPESCPFRRDPWPDDLDFTKEACSGCEYQCVKGSVALLKRAVAEVVDSLYRVIVDPAKCIVDFFSKPEVYQYWKIAKRREAHKRTWKRRDPKSGKQKKGR